MNGNPIIKREMRRLRLRRLGSGARWALILAAATSILLCGYWIVSDLSIFASDGALSLWQTMMVIQGFLVMIVAPAITAGSFSQEREQQTWEPLTSTPMTNFEIAIGKLIGKLGLCSIVIVLAQPVCLLLIFNVRYTEKNMVSIVAANCALLCIMVLFVVVSMFCSLVLRKTVHAIAVSYTLLVCIATIGTTVIASVLAMTGYLSRTLVEALTFLNPIGLLVTSTEPHHHGGYLAELLSFAAYTSISVILFTFITRNLRNTARTFPVR